jgi:hypothetical protein
MRSPLPIISIFMNIIIRINFRDHAPPHLHAEFKGLEGLFAIQTGACIAGGLPRKQHRLVRRWIDENREALMRNWNLAYDRQPTFKMSGLDDDD